MEFPKPPQPKKWKLKSSYSVRSVVYATTSKILDIKFYGLYIK